MVKSICPSKASVPAGLPILCTAQASGRFSLASGETLATNKLDAAPQNLRPYGIT